MGRPNFRERPYKPGRMSDERVSWVRTHSAELVRYESTGEDDELTSVRLSIRLMGAKPVMWVLHGMTLEELKAVRKFLKTTLKRVEPLIERLDKEACDDLEAGVYSISRSYRAALQLVT